INRVGCAEIPVGFGDTLAGGQDVETLVAFRPEEIPAHLQMPNQAMRLVLGRDSDATDAGVHGVREREIDDARLAAKVDGRLGAPVGELHQPAAAPAGEYEGQSV